MAITITFGNLKGGIGKSSCTLLIANAFSQAPFNYKVVVVDLDKQKSLHNSRQYDLTKQKGKPPYKIIDCSKSDFLENLSFYDDNFDIVLIDLGGKLDVDLKPKDQEITPILFYVDFVFIPIEGGNFALQASKQYFEYLTKVKAIKSELGLNMSVCGFINKYIKNRREDRQTQKDLEEFAGETGLRLMVNKLGFYSHFRTIDTFTSLYKSKTSDIALNNLRLWINELEKILSND